MKATHNNALQFSKPLIFLAHFCVLRAHNNAGKHFKKGGVYSGAVDTQFFFNEFMGNEYLLVSYSQVCVSKQLSLWSLSPLLHFGNFCPSRLSRKNHNLDKEMPDCMNFLDY